MQIIQCYKEGSKYNSLSEIEDVEKIEMICKHTYADTLIERNKKATILNIEQDILFNQEDIDEIANCPEPMCVFSYRLYPLTTGLPEPVIAHRNKTGATNFFFIPADYSGAFVDYAGFGFIKFKKGMLNILKFTEEEREWHAFDSRVSEKFFAKGIRFHLHPKILKHLHKEEL